jgi:SAM-dependent methyltransferase
MDQTMQQFKADFDRIALLSSDDAADHNLHYLDFLLQHLPPRCASALEIGCGTGTFSRLLAHRASRVLALDFSPNMIRLAESRSQEHTNIDFQCQDATTWEFPFEKFDCVASIATLHHLPMKDMLLKMKTALKPGGTLLLLDLFQMDGALDILTGALALPVSACLRLFKTGRLRAPREVRAAWEEHGQHDSYLKLSELRELCEAVLPAAQLRKHLLWRYSIVWKKPDNS